MKNFYTISITILSALLAITTTYANPLLSSANRTLCTPQNHDMTTGPFTTTCDWSKWNQGDEADALITLTGKQTVHGDCTFTGPNVIVWVRGMKQAKVNLFLPGNQFSFDVGYKNDNTDDENQNIAIYLKNLPPEATNSLTCTFTVKQ